MKRLQVEGWNIFFCFEFFLLQTETLYSDVIPGQFKLFLYFISSEILLSFEETLSVRPTPEEGYEEV